MLKKQTTLSGLHSPALLQLSHVTLHRHVLSDSFTSRAMEPVRYSTAVSSDAARPDGVSVFTEDFDRYSEPWLPSLGLVRYYCCDKLHHQAIIIELCDVCVCLLICCELVYACTIYIYECVSWQVTSLGSVLVRQSQCYLSVLAAHSLSQSHAVVTQSYCTFARNRCILTWTRSSMFASLHSLCFKRTAKIWQWRRYSCCESR